MQTARASPKAGVSAKRISSSFRDCNNYSIEMVLRKHNFVPIRVSCRCRFLRPHCGETLGLQTSPVSLADDCSLRPRCGGTLGCRRVLCLSCRRWLSSSALRRGPWAADESCVSLADCRRAVGTWGTHFVPLCTATCEAQAEACLQERYRGSSKQPKVPPQPPTRKHVCMRDTGARHSSLRSRRSPYPEARQKTVKSIRTWHPPQPPTSVQRTSDDSCPAPGRSGR